MPLAGLRDAGLTHPRFQMDLSYPSPTEEVLSPATTLPLAEGAGYDFNVTLAAGHLPTFGGRDPISSTWTPSVYFSGINAGAGSANIAYRLLKNGVSVVSGSLTAVAAGHYYTATLMDGNNWVGAVGDAFQLRLWCAAGSVSYDYRASAFAPTRIRWSRPPLAARLALTSTAIPVLTASLTPSLPTPSVYTGYVYLGTNPPQTLAIQASMAVPLLGWDATNGAFVPGSTTTISSGPGTRGTYTQRRVPSQIICYELDL